MAKRLGNTPIPLTGDYSGRGTWAHPDPVKRAAWLAKSESFQFTQVTPSDLPSIFETCHRKIWKAEKRSPASAFYEFAKVMFVKIDEDRKLHDRLNAQPVEMPEGAVPREMVRFSSYWIIEMEETTDNPLNTVLFAHLAQEIEERIERREKKRIFDQGEGIKLKPSTIKEVVKLLEHLDLYTVDEDLNGRLFETFLTATMRGEALGQFFTPRSVVKFMVKMARLQATPITMDTVLDGCCGTGGFLIEAMADMSDSLANNKGLSQSQRDSLMRKLRNEALWGIDAGQDPLMARIARLNMLLHKDGGSRIYFADALDKQLRAEPGLPIHTRLEIDELRNTLKAGTRFSVVLTNPPFSMTYERKDPEELAVLKDYTLAVNDKGKQRASLKSSVMFLERYWDILAEDGRLLTVMDDSILNTSTAKPFREWLLRHFVVRAIIALPKNAFVKAQGSVSTSVLCLTKKSNPEEPQPEVFMAICGNIGHSDTGKERPHLNELPGVLAAFHTYEETGVLPTDMPSSVFLVGAITDDNPTVRLDPRFFNPRYFATVQTLHNLATARSWQVVPLRTLLAPGKDSLTGGATPLGASYPDEGPKFIRVQNVRPHLVTWNPDEDPCIDTKTHNGTLKRSQLRESNVVLTITGTYGNAAVVRSDLPPANINQHSVRIVVNDQITPDYLAVFLNSGLCRPQMDRAVTGSSRLALDYTAIKNLLVLTYIFKCSRAPR